jgi:hypothetical protein
VVEMVGSEVWQVLALLSGSHMLNGFFGDVLYGEAKRE